MRELKQECWQVFAATNGIGNLPTQLQSYKLQSVYGRCIPGGAPTTISLHLVIRNGEGNVLGDYFAETVVDANGAAFTLAPGLNAGISTVPFVHSGVAATGALAQDLWISPDWQVSASYNTAAFGAALMEPFQIVIEYPWP